MHAFDRKPSSPPAQTAARQTTAAQPATDPAKPRYVWMYGTQTIGPGASRSKPSLKTTDENGQSPSDAPVASPGSAQPGSTDGAQPALGNPGAEPADTRKKAGATLSVTWRPNPNFGPNNAQLRIDFKAKFLEDATHDPAFAEFEQNAANTWSFSDGPRKGQKSDPAEAKLTYDRYSRRDDNLHAKYSYADTTFGSNDSPGFKNKAEIAADDVLDYSFTAEQLIRNNQTKAEVCKIPAHTETITGKHPRTSSLTKPVPFTATGEA